MFEEPIRLLLTVSPWHHHWLQRTHLPRPHSFQHFFFGLTATFSCIFLSIHGPRNSLDKAFADGQEVGAVAMGRVSLPRAFFGSTRTRRQGSKCEWLSKH